MNNKEIKSNNIKILNHLSFGALLLFSSCNYKDDKSVELKSDENQYRKEMYNSEVKKKEDDTLSKKPKLNFKQEQIYKYEYLSDSISQKLNFWFLNNKTIHFQIKLKSNNGKIDITGEAKLKEFSFDGESISNDEGELYFVTEYVTEYNNRPLVISIDENFKVVKIKIKDCLGIKNDIFEGTLIMFPVGKIEK